MAERTIVGVDFSGAEDERAGKTWITKGFLETEDSLELKKGTVILLSCQSVPRKKLTEKLKALPSDAIAALDFPFSVPIAFAEHLGHPGSEMPVLWQSVAPMQLNKFENEAKEFKGMLRVGDLHCTNAQPSLKPEGAPVMIKMTFRGMQMLHSLRQSGCRVPPLDDGEYNGATLVEVFPGAVLRAFQLPYNGYKGGSKAFDNRRKILKELPKHSGVNVINLRDFSEEAMFSDDALDSMVAAVAAAKWAMDESAFKRPSGTLTVEESCPDTQRLQRISPGIKSMKQLDAAKREGWIYVPKE